MGLLGLLCLVFRRLNFRSVGSIVKVAGIMDANYWLCEGVSGVENQAWGKALDARGPLSSAEQTHKRTPSPTNRKSKQRGGQKRICPRPPASLVLPRSSLCDNHCGVYISQRRTEKRERISKARIFFYFNGCVFPEAAVRVLWKRWFEGLEAERASAGAEEGEAAVFRSFKSVFPGPALVFHPFLFIFYYYYQDVYNCRVCIK